MRRRRRVAETTSVESTFADRTNAIHCCSAAADSGRSPPSQTGHGARRHRRRRQSPPRSKTLLRLLRPLPSVRDRRAGCRACGPIRRRGTPPVAASEAPPSLLVRPSVRCPRCLQRKREGREGGSANRCAPRARPLRFLGPKEIGEYLALTHPLTRSPHTHSLLPPLPSSPAHVATYHRFVTFVLAPFERFAPCQKPARRRNLQRSPELAPAPGLSHTIYGRYTMHSKGNDRSNRTEQKYLRRRHFLRNKGSGQEDKFFSRWGGRSGRRISGD